MSDILSRSAIAAILGLAATAAPPLLAVEILSPSTQLIDLNVKKAKLEQAGCPSYWIVDPALPSLTVWQLEDGTYRQVAHAEGDEVCTLDHPFPVTVVPTRLVSAGR